MSDDLGYINSFHGTTLVDSSYGIAKSVVGNTDQVISLIEKLDNGTVINFNGTSSSDTIPGKARQTIQFFGTTGLNILGVMNAKKGQRGTIGKIRFAGLTASTTGVLTDVIIDSVDGPNGSPVTVTFVWDLEDIWTQEVI